MVQNIAIIGAGLSGLACALYLARRKAQVSIYENRDLEEICRYDSVGRAMSMDLSERGIFALKELGVFKSIIKETVPMRQKIFHGNDGTLTYIPYGRHEQEYISTVSRNDLYRSLLKACELQKNIRIFFHHQFLSMDFSGPILRIRDKNRDQEVVKPFCVVVGADGSNSLVRQAFEKYTGVAFKTTLLRQGYKELSVPEEHAHNLEHNAMHLWSRDEFMLVAQPNHNGSFTGALLLPIDNHPYSFASITSDEALKALFLEHFADALPLMPGLFEEFRRHPLGRLRILMGSRYTCNGTVALIGDAAHGMVPFFGQGVNCCFEDCTVLNQCLDEAFDQWPIALTLFNERRVENGNAITTMSYDNYPELHQARIFHKVLLKKQIDALLNKRYASTYVGYHHLVCFHRVPYAYAMACKKLQEPMLDRLSQGISTVDELNWHEVDVELGHYRQQLELVSLQGVSHAH